MANDNQLQIDIVIDPSQAKAQVDKAVEQIAVSYAALQEKVKSQGRSIGQSSSSEYERWWKQALGTVEKRDMEMWRMRGQAAKEAAAVISATERTATAEADRIRRIQQTRDMEMWRMRGQAAKEQARIEAANHAASIKGILEEREATLAASRAKIAALKQERDAHAIGSDQRRVIVSLIKEQEMAEAKMLTGNARGRGELHRTMAAIASATFEATGAFYGLAAAASIALAPAAMGVRFNKQIEDARTGITGILLSMGQINGKTLEFGQAFAVAGQYAKQVYADSLRFNVDFGKLIEVNRASLGGGLGRGLGLEQIRKVSAAGAVAVGMLGLDSKQYVQEVRDIINGGIQAASSTLATAMGITDKTLKEWSKKGPETYMQNVMDKLNGFTMAAEKLQGQTLTGAWQILASRLSVLLSSEQGFTALKTVLMDVANLIGTIDKNTGELKLNPQFVNTMNMYWEQLVQILKVIGSIAEALRGPLGTAIGYVTEGFIAFKLAVHGFNAAGGLIDIVAGAFKRTAVAATESAVATTAAATAVEAASAKSAGIVATAGRGLFAARGGLFGLALWGLYEVADMFGLIDKFFSTAESRFEKLQQTTGQMSAVQTAQELVKAEKQLADIRKSAPDTILGFATGDKQQSIAEAEKRVAFLREQYTSKAQADVDMAGITSRFGNVYGGSTGGTKDKNAQQTMMQQLNEQLSKEENLLKVRAAYGSEAAKYGKEYVDYMAQVVALQELSKSKNLSKQQQDFISPDNIKATQGRLLAIADQRQYADTTDALRKEVERLTEAKVKLLGVDSESAIKTAEWHAELDKLTGSNGLMYVTDGVKSLTDAERQRVDVLNQLIAAQKEYDMGYEAAQARKDAERARRSFEGVGRTDQEKFLGLSQGARTRADAAMQEGNFRAVADSAAAARDYAAAADKSGIQQLDKYLNPDKVTTFSDAFKSGFDGMNASVKSVVTSLDEMMSKQREYVKQADAASKITDPAERKKQEIALTKKQTELQMQSYGQIAGAAKGFFGEQTAGFKALQAVEQGYRIWQLAMAAKNIAMNAIEGITNQAKGDPYTAFGRMAAMAAAMAALGAAVGGFSGGGGNVQTAEQVQKTQGTGTVLGDATAKSSSVQNSLDLIGKASLAHTVYFEQMVLSLKSVDKQMSAFANAVAKSLGSVTLAGSLGIALGTTQNANAGLLTSISNISAGVLTPAMKTFTPGIQILNGLVNKLLGSTTTTMTDKGLLGGGTIGQLQAGTGLKQYASFLQESSSWLGLNKSSSSFTNVAGAPAELSKTLGNIFASIADAIKVGAIQLGANAALITAALNKYVIDIGKLSLQGMSAADQQTAIMNVISRVSDQMTGAIMPSMRQFQQIGEGLLQTLVRVVSELATVNTFFGVLGTGAKATAASADALVQALGGLDQATQIMSKFVQNFAPQDAKKNLAFTAIDSALTAAGMAGKAFLIQTAQDFYNLMQTSTDQQKAILLQQQDNALTYIQAISTSISNMLSMASTNANTAKTEMQYLMNNLSSLASGFKGAALNLYQSLQQQLNPNYQMQNYRQGLANISQAYAQYQATGIAPNAANLQMSLQAVNSGNTTGMYASATDWKRGTQQTINLLGGMGSLADAQLTIQQQMATTLDKILQAAQDQKAAIDSGNATQAKAALDRLTVLQSNLAWLQQIDKTVLTGAQMGVNATDLLKGTVTTTSGNQVTTINTLDKSIQQVTTGVNGVQTNLMTATGATQQVTDTLVNGVMTTLANIYDPNGNIVQSLVGGSAQTSVGAALTTMAKGLSDFSFQMSQYLVYANANQMNNLKAAGATAIQQFLNTNMAGTPFNAAGLTSTANAAGGVDLSYKANSYTTLATTVGAGGTVGAITQTIDPVAQATAAAQAAQQAAAAKLQAAIKAISAAWTKAYAAAVTYWSTWPSNPATDTANSAAMTAAMTAYNNVKAANAVAGVNPSIKANANQYAAYLNSIVATKPTTGNYIANAAAAATASAAALPAFATGGMHRGGWRIVGEQGPELEYTGPSSITSNHDTKSLFDIAPLVAEIKQLRAELQAANVTIAQNTRDTYKQLREWEGNGLPETRTV